MNYRSVNKNMKHTKCVSNNNVLNLAIKSLWANEVIRKSENIGVMYHVSSHSCQSLSFSTTLDCIGVKTSCELWILKAS